MVGNDSSLSGDLDGSRDLVNPDIRLIAKNQIGKLKVQITAALPGKTLKVKTQLSAIEAGLDDLYKLFIEQAIELVKADQEIETLKLQVAEKDRRIPSFDDATRASVPEEVSRIQKSTRPEGSGRKTRTAGPSTDYVLLICPRDGKEGWKSVEKIVTKALRPDELKIEVFGKRRTHLGGLLVRLNSKKNAEILEKAVRRRMS